MSFSARTFSSEPDMRIILFSSRQYDVDTFNEANASFGFDLHFHDTRLDPDTAILARGARLSQSYVRR